MTRRRDRIPIERKKAVEILAVEGSSEKIYIDSLVRMGDVDLAVRTVNCHGRDVKNVVTSANALLRTGI